jgi:hypothetical protein
LHSLHLAGLSRRTESLSHQANPFRYCDVPELPPVCLPRELYSHGRYASGFAGSHRARNWGRDQSSIIAGDGPVKFHAMVVPDIAPQAFIATLTISRKAPTAVIGFRILQSANGIASTPKMASSTNHGTPSAISLGP